MSAASTPQTDYVSAQVAVVVRVSWLGRVWTLSHREIVGSDYHAIPGLLEMPDVEDSVSLSSADAGLTVSLALVLPVDVLAMVEAGYDIQDVTAEVSWVGHRAGEGLHEWAARTVLAEGFCTGAQWGQPDRPAGWLACSVEDSPYRARWPSNPWAMEVTSGVWPTSPDDFRGQMIPLVFGAPAWTTVFSSEYRDQAPPAPAITSTAGNVDAVAISSSWVRAGTITIRDDAGAFEDFAVGYTAGASGVQVASANISAAATISRTSASYTSFWRYGEALSPFGTRCTPLLAAAHLLALSGADLDLPEWLSIASLVGGELSGHLDDPETDGWEVARAMLEALPVSTRRTIDGWGPVVLDPSLAASLTVGILRADGPWRRVSAWQSEGTARTARVERDSRDGTLTVGAGSDYDAPLPHGWIRHLDHASMTSGEDTWSWRADMPYRSIAWLARIQAMGWEASAWRCPAQYALPRAGEWWSLVEGDRTSSVLVQRRGLIASGGVLDYTLVRPAGAA